MKRSRGFSLIQMLVVVAIVSVLSAIILASSFKSRSYGRDAQVRADTQTLKLALARAAQVNVGGSYPGTANTWYCLKTSGTCWRNTYSANASLNTTLLPYIPGSTYPTPPISTSGQYRHNAYVYTPSASGIIAGYTGPILVWWQEKVITDCSGHYAGQLDTGVYYCYERLQ